jgi:GLPGLI family protein
MLPFIFLIFPYFVGEVLSQNGFTNKTIGKMEYVVNTKLAFSDDVNGIYIMYFNDTASYMFNSTLPEAGAIVQVNEHTAIAKIGDKDGLPLYKNVSVKNSEQKHFIIGQGYKYIVQDTLPAIKWMLTSDVKTIEKYKVQKATGTYGGRVYDVWFTHEIPVSNGPFRMQGLPGMILEAKSRDGKIDIAFKSVQFNPDFSGMIVPLSKKFNYEVMDYKAYLEKKKIAEKRMAIAINGDGAYLHPADKTLDYQIEKNYH